MQRIKFFSLTVFLFLILQVLTKTSLAAPGSQCADINSNYTVPIGTNITDATYGPLTCNPNDPRLFGNTTITGGWVGTDPAWTIGTVPPPVPGGCRSIYGVNSTPEGSSFTDARTSITYTCTAGTWTSSGPPITSTTTCNSFLDCTSIRTKPNDAGYNDTNFLTFLISQFLPVAIILGGFISVIIVVISGLQFITSNGNPEGAAAARGRLIFALVGFVLLTLAFAITKVIDTLLLRGSGIF